MSEPAAFPPTRWSLIAAARGGTEVEARDALDRLCRLYWTPLYAYARRWGAAQDAAPDLVQTFLSRFIERGDLIRSDPQKGRFRSFLLGAFQNFLTSDLRREQAQKRGGSFTFVPMGETGREEEWHSGAAQGLGPEEAFDRRWAEEVMGRAIARLETDYRRAGQENTFAVLRPVLAGAPLEDTATLGRRLRMTPGGAGSALHRVRARFRDALLTEVRETVAEPQEADGELRYLLALLAR